MSTMANTPSATAPTVKRSWRALASRIWAAYELGRSRTQLRALPDHLLADIGVSPDEARSESERPLWDVPSWWRN